MDSPIGLTAGLGILTVPKCLYNFGTVSKTGKIDRRHVPDSIIKYVSRDYSNGTFYRSFNNKIVDII